MTNRRQIAVSAAGTFTAEFEYEQLVTVAASPAAGGWIEGAGWVSGPFAVLTAIPEVGFRFVRWNSPNGLVIDANPITVAPGSPFPVTALFDRVEERTSFTSTKLWSGTGYPPTTVINAYGQALTRSRDLSRLRLWQPVEGNAAEGAVVDIIRLGVFEFGQAEINDYGQIATYRSLPSGEAILWQPNEPHGAEGTFFSLPGAHGSAVGINLYGQIYPLEEQAIWTPATPNATAGSNLRSNANRAFRLDDAGNVLVPELAQYFRADSVSRKVDPKPVPVPTELAGLKEFRPTDITGPGVIFGTACEITVLHPACRPHVVLWNPGSADEPPSDGTKIGLPEGVTLAEVKAVNRLGQMIVNVRSVDLKERPLFFDGEQWMDLSLHSPDFANATALDLNDRGQIVLQNYTERTREFAVYLLTPIARQP